MDKGHIIPVELISVSEALLSTSYLITVVQFLFGILMELSERERITLLMMRGYGDRQRSYREVCNLFNDTFPERNPISVSTISKTIERFEMTGSVRNRPKSGRIQSATDEEHALDVLQTFIEDPHTSLRKAAQQHDMHPMSVSKILKINKYKPFKVHLVQQLSEDDYDRRVEFCELVMRKCDDNRDFLTNILFSDEATFFLNGNVNRHNCRYWASENPHWITESHSQQPQKLNVWCGILGNKIVGPFFINGNLNAELYYNMLQNEIIPAIQIASGEYFDNVWFQQDGAPPHYGRQVREYLDLRFPHKWIGRRGEIEWPPRSPDLSPIDYFLWGHLKSNVYRRKPHNLEDLRNRIIEEIALITEEMLGNSVESFYTRLAHCQTVEGTQFEQLL
uniref:DUF4817 domain-containing protein n=1 Tax=Homalodisca liturata TaxID=320908 RepID=A0A1B6HYH3_9HEMI